MGIGSKIKELRLKNGITQEILAAKIGVTPSAVGNYERDVSFPKEDVLMRLFSALNCTPNELLGAEQSISPREREHLNKFVRLDEQGKTLVERLTEVELQRTLSETEELRIAARKGSSDKPVKLKKRADSGFKSVLDLPDYKGGRK